MSVNGFDINGTIVKYDYNELDNAPIVVDSNGDGAFSGKLTVGTAPTNNMDVATKKYVDDNIDGASNTFIIEWNELTSTFENFDNIVAAYEAGKTLVLHLTTGAGNNTALDDEFWLSDYVHLQTETEISGQPNDVTKEFYFDVPLGRSGGIPTEYAIIGHYSNNTLIVAEYEPFVYSGVIPKTALASAVQTSLGKADTAYQKPSGGIPASDLASGVIPSVPSAATSAPSNLASSAAVGSSSKYAKEDHVHKMPSASDVGALPSNTTYVSTVNGSSGAVTLTIPSTAADIGAAPAVTEVTISTAGAVSQALDPGKLYHFTGALTALTITLNAAGTGVIPQYHFDFDCGSTAPTVTIPNTVVLPSNNTFDASTHYEVDILNNYGVVASWATS